MGNKTMCYWCGDWIDKSQVETNTYLVECVDCHKLGGNKYRVDPKHFKRKLR